jgi:hypothetical protein
MSNANSVLKNKKILGLLAIVLIVIIVGVVYYSGRGGTAAPTMASLVGTYSSSESGYSITLYENGTALFSTISGTWNIVNSTTIEGTYRVFNAPRDDFFTLTNNGFTAVGTGNVYTKK